MELFHCYPLQPEAIVDTRNDGHQGLRWSLGLRRGVIMTPQVIWMTQLIVPDTYLSALASRREEILGPSER
jgi:hypothetical protein